jgi:hypothetical protein
MIEVDAGGQCLLPTLLRKSKHTCAVRVHESPTPGEGRTAANYLKAVVWA